MANPFTKAWRYLMALFSSKVDEYADPKVQIQQAIEEAQRQHQGLTQQAAQVIGNQRQLEMRLNRQLADIEKLQVNVRQALTLADQATAAGDAAKATEYTNAAEAFAAQLVTAEQSVEDLKGLHDQALQAAGQAKKAVEQNAMMLQQKIAERTKLLSQLEQAKMQEQVSASLRSMSELAAPGNTPSLDEVRDKIERRYANAIGSAELAQNSVQGRMLEVQSASVRDGRAFAARADPRVDARRPAACGRSRLGYPGTRNAGRHPEPDTGKPAVAVTFGDCGDYPMSTRTSRPEALALVGATRGRHRRGVVRHAGPEAQRGRRSAGQVVAQAALGVSTRRVLHGLGGVLGGCDRAAGIVEHAGLGAVHPGADRRRCRIPRDPVVPALPLAAWRAAAAAADPGSAAVAAVGIGRPSADGGAGSVRTRAVLAAGCDGAGPDAARRRTA